MTRRLWLGLALAAVALRPLPVAADIPDDKTERVREYLERRVVVTQPASDSYELRLGGERIGDRRLAGLSGNEEIRERVASELGRRQLWQLAWGATTPLGAFVLYENFLGNQRAAGAPPARLAFWPDDDLRSFALSVAGGALAAYGIYNLSQWVADRLGLSFPMTLEPRVAERLAERHNRGLREELNLEVADIPKGTESLAVRPDERVTLPKGLPTGVEGSAAFYLETAYSAIAKSKGEGYSLFVVYTKDLSNQSGKLIKGAWNYLFWNPRVAEAIEVTVPVFGANVTVNPAPEAFRDWLGGEALPGRWTIDSPAAMTGLQVALQERGIPWFADEATFILYPRYGLYRTSIWVIDLGNGPLDIAYDGSQGTPIDLREARPGPLPAQGGTPNR